MCVKKSTNLNVLKNQELKKLFVNLLCKIILLFVELNLHNIIT